MAVQKSITDVQNRILSGYSATLRNAKFDKNGGISELFQPVKSQPRKEPAARFSFNAITKSGVKVMPKEYAIM
jgi:hypothetical protein